MKVYILEWSSESGDRGIEGYWSKPLTEEEQHGYFMKNYSGDYNPSEGRFVHWEQIELELKSKPAPKPKEEWLDCGEIY